MNTVLITGASTGIGRACVCLLDEKGYQVFAGVRRQEDADSITAQCSGRVKPIQLDVTKTEQIIEARQIVEASLNGGRLVAVVNNAGVGYGQPMEAVDLEEFRRLMEVNLYGPIAVIQAFLPLLRRDRGRIVNMSSVLGKMAVSFVGPYSASKHALEAISDAMRQELHPWGIHVSLIEPGAIKTPIWEKSLTQGEQHGMQMTDDLKELYGQTLLTLRESVANTAQKAIEPLAVARAVYHAVASPRPRIRYPVGTDAKIGLTLCRWMPDRLFDWLARKRG